MLQSLARTSTSASKAEKPRLSLPGSLFSPVGTRARSQWGGLQRRLKTAESGRLGALLSSQGARGSQRNRKLPWAVFLVRIERALLGAGGMGCRQAAWSRQPRRPPGPTSGSGAQ